MTAIKEEELRDLIKSNPNKVNWNRVSYSLTLSEEFIREFQDKVFWRGVSSRQTLSEDFIREFQDKVNWFNISSNQILSEDFIREFQDKLDHKYVFIYQDYSDDFDLMNNYIENDPRILRISKTMINIQLLEELGACEDGVDRFLVHTDDGESINWSELKKRHVDKSDIAWLFDELLNELF